MAWRNTDGKDYAGVVTFHRLDDARTRVMVQMDFVPEGLKEKLGDAIGAPDRRVKGDLERLQGADREPRPRDRRLTRRGQAAGRDLTGST